MFGSPFKNFKIKDRKKHDPIYVQPGDSIVYTYKEPGQPDKVLMVDKIEKWMTIDEVVVFRAEFEGREALGGLMLETKEDARMKR